MAYSYTDYSGTGALTQFAVPFPYLDKGHVTATVGGIGATFTWLNDTTIVFTAAPAVGTNNIRIIRVTPIATLRQTFVDGSTLTQDQLNQQNKQTLYALQEDADSFALSKPIPSPIPGGVIGWDPGGTYLVTLNPGSVALAVPASGSVDQSKLAVDVQYQVDTIAALKSLLTKYNTVLVRGYYVVGDGGGGVFTWNSVDVTADNGGTVIIPNAGGTGRWNRITDKEMNIRWFGAKGDNTADDAAAIQAAYNAISSSGGVLRIPNGTYKYGSALVFNRAINLSIVGSGRDVSLLTPTFAAGDSIQMSNFTQLTMYDFGITPTVDRTLGTWLINCDASNSFEVLVSRTKLYTYYGGVFKITGHTSPRIHDNMWFSWAAAHTDGDCVLRMIGANEPIVSNNHFFNGNSANINFGADRATWLTATAYALNDIVAVGTGSTARSYMCAIAHTSGVFATDMLASRWVSAGRYARAPVAWISGSTTSVKFTGNILNGGGPRNRYAIRSITNFGATFQIIMDGNTAGTFFKPGEYLVVRNANVAAFNSIWRISAEDHSGSFSIITVAATVAGTPTWTGLERIEDMAATLVIDNAGDGTGLGASVNESNLCGNLCEASVWAEYGSAAVMFDGRRGNRYLSGWLLTGNYYDFGDNGIVLAGFDAASTDSPTVAGISIDGGIFESRSRWLLIDQASGVCATNLQGPAFETTKAGDGLNATGTGSTAIHVIASSGVGTSKSRGITITNSNLGMCRLWSDGAQATSGSDHAMVLDGAGIQDVLVSNCNMYGRGGVAIRYDNSSLADTSRWKFSNVQIKVGAAPWVAADMIPSTASATSVTLARGYEVQKITGTTNIQTILGGHVGRQLKLLFTGALSLVTGGNFALAANYSVLAGQQVSLTFDGSLWYVK